MGVALIVAAVLLLVSVCYAASLEGRANRAERELERASSRCDWLQKRLIDALTEIECLHDKIQMPCTRAKK